MLITTQDKFTIIHRSAFLRRVQESFWKLAIIELTKLYGDNPQIDHFSVLILIKNLPRHNSDSLWQNIITPKELKEIEAPFKTQEMKIRIKKLKELRNQHYAYTDKKPDNNIYGVKLYFDDCIFLIEQTEQTIKILTNKIEHEMINYDYNYKGEQMDEFIENYTESLTLSAMYKMYSANT